MKGNYTEEEKLTQYLKAKNKKTKKKKIRKYIYIYIFGQQVTDTDIFCSAHGSMLSNLFLLLVVECGHCISLVCQHLGQPVVLQNLHTNTLRKPPSRQESVTFTGTCPQLSSPETLDPELEKTY